MKDLVKGDTPLERWKMLAAIENARARKTWGFAGKAGWPDDPGAGAALSPQSRAERNARVQALARDGRSIPQISRATGIANTTVWRILHGKAAGS